MDWAKQIRNCFVLFLRRHPHLEAPTRKANFQPRTVWDRLTAEGNHELIHKLQKVERRETGYGTIVIPKEGFSKDPETHAAVIAWLDEQKTLALNPSREVAELEISLHVS